MPIGPTPLVWCSIPNSLPSISRSMDTPCDRVCGPRSIRAFASPTRSVSWPTSRNCWHEKQGRGEWKKGHKLLSRKKNLEKNKITWLKKVINHPPNHHFYRWYKPFPNGWCMALFYSHYLVGWLTWFSTCSAKWVGWKQMRVKHNIPSLKNWRTNLE